MKTPFKNSITTLAAWSLICLSVVQANSSWVNPNDTTLINQEICEGDCAIIGSTTYCQPGIYTAIFSGTNNCDSVVIISIDVIEKVFLDFLLCEEDCIYIPEIDSTFCPQTSGIFIFPIGSCEEAVTIFVEMGDLSFPIVYVDICLGECVDLGPFGMIDTLCPTQDTVAYLLFENLCMGMDSMEVNISVTGSPSLDSLIFNICEGDCIDFDGGTFCNDFSTTTTFISSGGCDSTIYFEVNVESAGDDVQLGICQGECIEWLGMELCTDTTIIETITTPNGCLQTHVISVEVINTNTVLLPADTSIFLEDSLVFEIDLENLSVTWNTGVESNTFVFLGSEFGIGIHPIYATIVENTTGCIINTDTTFVEVLLIDSNEALNPASDIQIFPNPINIGQSLQIFWPKSFTEKEFSIGLHTVQGALILNKSMVSTPLNSEIEIANSLVPGIYILTIQGKEKHWVKKLLVQ